ncbi:MAG TPA: ABC transporter substrate-binding protein [Terriglobales bacterium]|nr:ABC transporter substrate-binding protein [Terriglobales bacterium]
MGYLDLTRRDVLRIGGYASVAAFLAACSRGGGSSPSASAGPGTVSVGSNQSDTSATGGPRKGMADVTAAYQQATGDTLKVNTVDHGTFQDQISSYLQGTPEDTFTWFSGHRMRFFAAQGLATPVDDVWNKVKGNYTSAFAEAVKGDDGHIYGIPVDYYPWAVFYRKSVFAQHNYQIPTNWDDFKALCTQMKKDGLVPIAIADKDGWPAQGTFDILNLRLNGYDFHVNLLNGKQKWTDSKVTNVFKKWAELTPFYNEGAAGMKWQDGADLLIQKKAGMTVIGLFISQQFQASDVSDLDFFPFPDMGTQYDAEKALDAPIDVMMMTKRSPTLSADMAAAKRYLEFWAKGSTQVLMYHSAPGFIPAASDADSSSFDALTKKAVQIVGQAKRITQYFDRDSRPDYAGPNGMQQFLLNFLANPTANPSNLQGTMQQFWDSLPPEK